MSRTVGGVCGVEFSQNGNVLTMDVEVQVKKRCPSAFSSWWLLKSHLVEGRFSEDMQFFVLWGSLSRIVSHERNEYLGTWWNERDISGGPYDLPFDGTHHFSLVFVTSSLCGHAHRSSRVTPENFSRFPIVGKYAVPLLQYIESGPKSDQLPCQSSILAPFPILHLVWGLIMARSSSSFLQLHESFFFFFHFSNIFLL